MISSIVTGMCHRKDFLLSYSEYYFISLSMNVDSGKHKALFHENWRK